MRLIIEIDEKYLNQPLRTISLLLEDLEVTEIITHDVHDYNRFNNLNFQVLPKGHGRLIDADKLKNIYPTNKAMHDTLHHAKTVVKADKERAE